MAVYSYRLTQELQLGHKPIKFVTDNKEMADLAETMMRVVVKQLELTPDIPATEMGRGFLKFCYQNEGSVEQMKELLQAWLQEQSL